MHHLAQMKLDTIHVLITAVGIALIGHPDLISIMATLEMLVNENAWESGKNITSCKI